MKSTQNMVSKEKKEVRKILKDNQHIFSVDVKVGFKIFDTGKTRYFTATKGKVFYSRKDVLKIIRLLKMEEQGK